MLGELRVVEQVDPHREDDLGDAGAVRDETVSGGVRLVGLRVIG